MLAPARAPLPKIGDRVETPTGRIGVIFAVAAGGRREIRYLDLEGGEVNLPVSLITILVRGPPPPWSGPRSPH